MASIIVLPSLGHSKRWLMVLARMAAEAGDLEHAERLLGDITDPYGQELALTAMMRAANSTDHPVGARIHDRGGELLILLGLRRRSGTRS